MGIALIFFCLIIGYMLVSSSFEGVLAFTAKIADAKREADSTARSDTFDTKVANQKVNAEYAFAFRANLASVGELEASAYSRLAKIFQMKRDIISDDACANVGRSPYSVRAHVGSVIYHSQEISRNDYMKDTSVTRELVQIYSTDQNIFLVQTCLNEVKYHDWNGVKCDGTLPTTTFNGKEIVECKTLEKVERVIRGQVREIFSFSARDKRLPRWRLRGAIGVDGKAHEFGAHLTDR